VVGSADHAQNTPLFSSLKKCLTARQDGKGYCQTGGKQNGTKEKETNFSHLRAIIDRRCM